ncbi:MAG: cytochrome P450 [Acidimicrobiales bacterium]|nr:cytochrome P450 [Acidimicrobiales bacterium]
MTTTTTPLPDLVAPEFWNRTIEERAADLAVIREAAPFTEWSVLNLLTLAQDPFWAATRHADILEISRNAKVFCSGQGSTAIQDMPPEAAELFGSFITMDDPRHARLRGIVSRSFTPRRLQSVLDSVETICTEVIDGMCEQGEVDLVETVSAPFPLLVICDMMGIPRSEFTTVLDATNVILGSGDPDTLNGENFFTGLFSAGQTLIGLMQEVAEHRRANPADDLTTELIHGVDAGDDVMGPEDLGPFFILLAVAGNDTTRTATSLGMHLLGRNPDQKRLWQKDLDDLAPTAVEEIVRMASPVTFMRRTVTEPTTLSGNDFDTGDRVVMLYGAANRDPRVFEDPERFDVTRAPNPHVGFGGPGPHFCLGAHLARRELAVVFRQLLTRMPDIEPVADPVHLNPLGIPLVGGVKELRVRFTPSKPLEA